MTSTSHITTDQVIPISDKPISSVDQLSGWKKVALLAPKLIFSGAGWVLGFLLGGILGSGLGDAIGTYIGCVISLGLEIAIRKGIYNDQTLNIAQLANQRLKEGLILSTGCLIGGITFGKAMHWTASLSSIHDCHFIQSIAIGAITASGFLSGTTSARLLYNAYTALTGQERDDKYELSWKNLMNDLRTATWIILPAEAAFAATSIPVLGTKFLLTRMTESTVKQMSKGALSVLIGGLSGKAVSEISQKGVELFLPPKSSAAA